MNDWFQWKGIRSTDYGIYVLEQPPLTMPEERVTFTDVPGRSGSLTTLEGDDVYDDLTLTAECIVKNTDNYNEVAAYLRGSDTVTFANRQGGYYYARITNQIPFETILRGNPHRSFSVNFRCKPFWYYEDNTTITLTESSGIFSNPGCVAAEPIITVYGTGDITLSFGSQILELTEIEDGITMDTSLQEAYYNGTSMNSHMDGEFLTLSAGTVTYAWTGDVTSIEIQPNWRTL